MAKKRNPFQSFILRLAATKPGAWLLARTLHHLDTLFVRLSRGRLNLTSLLTGIPVMLITTTGARSGLRRTTPLLPIYREEDSRIFALVATNFGQAHYPSWYFNLKAHPNAVCSIGGVTHPYLAHEATGQEYDLFWECATRIYIGYSFYKQRIHGRRVPIMVMAPIQEK